MKGGRLEGRPGNREWGLDTDGLYRWHGFAESVDNNRVAAPQAPVIPTAGPSAHASR